MSNLSSYQFGPDVPLAQGRTAMPLFPSLPAEPHEQTETQFNNRPDVYYHGRFQPGSSSHADMPIQRSPDFHAGSPKASVDRMNDLGPRAWKQAEPRFYAGRVNPYQMRNRPDAPVRDMGETWDRSDLDQYYKNEYEDKGSTSVILNPKMDNFTPWRSHVSEALRTGREVPAHVKAVYEAGGGEKGPITHHPADYREPLSNEAVKASPAPYKQTDDVINSTGTPGGTTWWYTALHQNPPKTAGGW